MNTRLFGLVALSLGACSDASVTSQSDHLIASNDAQRLGVFSYTVEADRATMFDKDGIEFGQMTISVPAADRRLLRFELANGANDEVEVYRPKTDGTFFAPISPVTATTAVAADPALAPLLATFQITLHAIDNLRLAPGHASPETVASLSACTGGGTPGQPWTYTTPAGCVKSANTTACIGSVCCDNVSQKPADMFYDSGNNAVISSYGYSTETACLSGLTAWCNSHPGAGNYSSKSCVFISPGWTAECIGHWTTSEWVASCAPSTCVAPYYDAVPRQDNCFDPGSCTFQQGSITCMTYHNCNVNADCSSNSCNTTTLLCN